MPRSSNSSKDGSPKTRAKPPGRRRGPRRSYRAPADWQDRFLAAYRAHMMSTHAAHIAGVGYKTYLKERQQNEAFAVACADVEEHFTQQMEREAFRRAVKGTDKPVVSMGEVVTTEKQFSDTLLIFLLKSRRPETYRDNYKVEHSGKIETQLDLTKLTEEQLESLLKVAQGEGADAA